MKFGVRECANIVFRAKQPIRIGTATFQTGQPVLYIDTATTSSMEQSTTTVYAQGGRGNTRLLAWEGQKTLTFSFTDALLSPIGFAILSGAGLFKRGNGNQQGESGNLVHFHMTSGAELKRETGEGASATTGIIDLRNAIAEFGTNAKICINDAPIYIMEQEADGSLTGVIYSGQFDPTSTNGLLKLTGVKKDGVDVDAVENAAVMVDYYIDLPGMHVWEADITPETFGGNYYVEADTLFRDQHTGADLPANLTFPNVRLQSNFTMTFAGSGDPSTFDFTMDAFPDYTYFDNKKKVLCAMQIVDTIELGAVAKAIQGDDPVMYHDATPQHAEAAAHDSNLTNKDLGSDITSITWQAFTGNTSDSTYGVFLPNEGDVINLGNYIKIMTEDGETSLSNYAPRIEVTQVNGTVTSTLDLKNEFTEVYADGTIRGIKNTQGTPVKVTYNFTQATSANKWVSGFNPISLEVNVETPAANG